MNNTFFRKEAVENKSGNFVSSTTLVSPLSFSIVSLFVVLLAICILLFVFIGKYSPKDTVRGFVATTMGDVEVYAPSDSTIIELFVSEGELVSENQELMALSTSRGVGQSASSRSTIVAQLKAEQAELLLQTQLEVESSDAQALGIHEEIASLGARLELLVAQREVLAEGLYLSERELQRLSTLDSSKFVSERDQDVARAAIVEFQLRIRDLDLSADTVTSDIRRNRQMLEEIPIRRDARAAEMRARLHQLSISLTESQGNTVQRLVAPSAGIVSGLLVRQGQTISMRNPLLNIIPERGIFYVEILIPTRSIAFVRPKAKVKIRYDAYPYQKFGTYEGIIESVARTTVLPTDKRFRVTITEPVYIAHVRVSNQSVLAYGVPQPLQSGMTLSADVLRDERRLIEWIFDPMIGALQRL